MVSASAAPIMLGQKSPVRSKTIYEIDAYHGLVLEVEPTLMKTDSKAMELESSHVRMKRPRERPQKEPPARKSKGRRRSESDSASSSTHRRTQSADNASPSINPSLAPFTDSSSVAPIPVPIPVQEQKGPEPNSLLIQGGLFDSATHRGSCIDSGQIAIWMAIASARWSSMMVSHIDSGKYYVMTLSDIKRGEVIAVFPPTPPVKISDRNPLMYSGIPFANRPGYYLPLSPAQKHGSAAVEGKSQDRWISVENVACYLLDVLHIDWMPRALLPAGYSSEKNNAVIFETACGKMFAIAQNDIPKNSRIWLDYGVPYWFPSNVLIPGLKETNPALHTRLCEFMPVMRKVLELTGMVVSDRLARKRLYAAPPPTNADPPPAVNLTWFELPTTYDIFSMVGNAFLFFCTTIVRRSDDWTRYHATVSTNRRPPIAEFEELIDEFYRHLRPGLGSICYAPPPPSPPYLSDRERTTVEQVCTWLNGGNGFTHKSRLSFLPATNPSEALSSVRRYMFSRREENKHTNAVSRPTFISAATHTSPFVTVPNSAFGPTSFNGASPTPSFAAGVSLNSFVGNMISPGVARGGTNSEPSPTSASPLSPFSNRSNRRPNRRPPDTVIGDGVTQVSFTPPTHQPFFALPPFQNHGTQTHLIHPPIPSPSL